VKGALAKGGIGEIQPGDALLFNFGWWPRWPDDVMVDGGDNVTAFRAPHGEFQSVLSKNITPQHSCLHMSRVTFYDVTVTFRAKSVGASIDGVDRRCQE